MRSNLVERDDVLLLHHKLADLHSLRLVGGVTVVQFRAVTLQVDVTVANANISTIVVCFVNDFLFLQTIMFLMFI